MLLQQIHFWLQRARNEKDPVEGRERIDPDDGTNRMWIAQTLDFWHSEFSFWSKRTLRRKLDSLVEDGLLRRHKFNSNQQDHTYSYAIDYAAVRAAVDDAEVDAPDAQEKVEDETQKQMFDDPSQNGSHAPSQNGAQKGGENGAQNGGSSTDSSDDSDGGKSGPESGENSVVDNSKNGVVLIRTACPEPGSDRLSASIRKRDVWRY